MVYGFSEFRSLMCRVVILFFLFRRMRRDISRAAVCRKQSIADIRTDVYMYRGEREREDMMTWLTWFLKKKKKTKSYRETWGRSSEE